MSKQKIILAYSGGLDTSVAIKWLEEEYGFEVIALAIDVGQGKELEAIQAKALEIGAVESIVVDATAEFATDFILPTLKANAVYEGKYPLATALARPLIAKHLVDAAKVHGAVAVAHGSTGKGNDQVRFDVSVNILNPRLEIIAPARVWTMSREESMAYAEQRGIPVPVTSASPFSIDENIWGRSIECGELEDPWIEPPAEAYKWTKSIEDAPNLPEYIEITFEAGKPVAVNSEIQDLVGLVNWLNATGGKHGIGRIDMVENRLVGIKSREIYEAPAAEILVKAHHELEALVLTKDVLHFKTALSQKYAEMIYDGQWFSPLRQALDAFFDQAQKRVTGVVRVKLFKGNAIVVGRKSTFSLYDKSLATYEAGDSFKHDSAVGFIDIWGLPLRVWAQREKDEEP